MSASFVVLLYSCLLFITIVNTFKEEKPELIEKYEEKQSKCSLE